MGILYAKAGKIYTREYMELYIPMVFFDDGIASNKGATIETLGLLYTRGYEGGSPGPIRFFNIPTVINVNMYDFKQETIKLPNGKSLDVMTLSYMKDSCVMHQTVTKGREVAEQFLAMMLNGKLPKTLDYRRIINLWWKNLEISGVSFKVPSKIYEMIIASIYRSPSDPKERYGQYFGRQSNPSGFDYKTGNVRAVVKELSTFSGMVFEDIGTMISHGISNSLDNVEEPVSPLEKIIHY